MQPTSTIAVQGFDVPPFLGQILRRARKLSMPWLPGVLSIWLMSVCVPVFISALESWTLEHCFCPVFRRNGLVNSLWCSPCNWEGCILRPSWIPQFVCTAIAITIREVHHWTRFECQGLVSTPNTGLRNLSKRTGTTCWRILRCSRIVNIQMLYPWMPRDYYNMYCLFDFSIRHNVGISTM